MIELCVCFVLVLVYSQVCCLFFIRAQLLDTTMKMVTNVTSRLEVVDISKD